MSNSKPDIIPYVFRSSYGSRWGGNYKFVVPSNLSDTDFLKTYIEDLFSPNFLIDSSTKHLFGEDTNSLDMLSDYKLQISDLSFPVFESENINIYNILGDFPAKSIRSQDLIKVESYVVDKTQEEESIICGIIHSEPIDYGEVHPIETHIRELLEKDQHKTLTLLQDIFARNFRKDLNLILGILVALANSKFETIYPGGYFIACSALTHKDIRVKDGAVRAFEKWANPMAISNLESMDLAPEWFAKYVKKVIGNLRNKSAN